MLVSWCFKYNETPKWNPYRSRKTETKQRLRRREKRKDNKKTGGGGNKKLRHKKIGEKRKKHKIKPKMEKPFDSQYSAAFILTDQSCLLPSDLFESTEMNHVASLSSLKHWGLSCSISILIACQYTP
jgi:hypothetical protein